MCINLVRPSKGFHTNFCWLYQVDLPDVCLKHIFVFVFFSNEAIQTKHKSLLKSMYPFDESFIFLGHLSKFIPGHWCQTRENNIYICEYLGLDVCALPLLTGEKDISHSPEGPGQRSLSCESRYLVHSHSLHGGEAARKTCYKSAHSSNCLSLVLDLN